MEKAKLPCGCSVGYCWGGDGERILRLGALSLSAAPTASKARKSVRQLLDSNCSFCFRELRVVSLACSQGLQKRLVMQW